MTEISNCPICSSNTITVRYRGEPVRPEWRDGQSFEVMGCENCGHGFMLKQLLPQELDAYYNRQYSAFHAGHGVNDLDEMISETAKSRHFRHVDLYDSLRVLDIGCGSGTFLRVIRDSVAQVQGIEPSAHGVASCEALGVPVFHGTTTEFLEQNNETFDLVTLNHVVEHHPDPQQLFSELRRLIRPGGRIWLSVPNAGCFFSKRLRANWHSSDLPVHLQHFSIDSMKTLIAKNSLEIEDIRTESENSIPNSVATLLRRRFLVPGRASYPLLCRLASKNSILGRWIDRAGHGEAIIASAIVAD